MASPVPTARDWVNVLKTKYERHRTQSFPVLASKSVAYARGVLMAPLYLHAVDKVGHGVRTLGRPRIVNFGRMEIGDDTILCSLMVPLQLCTDSGAQLKIGSDCSLNYGTSIGVTSSVIIGNRVRFGPYVMVVDSDFHDVYERAKRPPSEQVVIEDDVWIGAKATVLPGVHIGRGSVVGTGSVVNRDVEPFTVVGGVPAKPIKRLDPDKFAHLNSKQR